MMHSRKYTWMVCLVAVFGLVGEAARAQSVVSDRPLASNVVVPQTRAFSVDSRGRVEITEVTVGVVILEQTATTTMDISLNNPGNGLVEAELIVPVPDGAVVRTFAFQGSSSEPTAQVLPKDEGIRTYDAIVAKVRDPALLEFAGYNLIRSSVFPVPPRGTQKVRLTYEHLLTGDGDRIDYVLPRSESLDYVVPWKVSVKIKSKRPISTVYSPTHKLETVRSAANTVSARIADDATTAPGPLRLSYLLERGGVTASLFAYPEPNVGGGYFLLIAGLPAEVPRGDEGPAIKREVTLVFDHSGSMRNEKIEQVREAALQILAGLEEGEAFNIITYNETVDLFSKEPIIKSPESIRAAQAYLQGINAQGGTNIHDALLEALRQKPVKGFLPIVLFLTDGLPTIGQTSEIAIRNVAIKANPHNRRVFTFGVGVDVNAPLLERIASETRAVATFALPKEDVEVKVAQVFKRLAGPVLADTQLAVLDSTGQPAADRVRDMVPGRLPDLFEDDQLVLAGQYLGDEPLTFAVSGNYLGTQRTFQFSFNLENATTRNAFVPRLWASRKIGVLVDAISQLGADGGPREVNATSDPKVRELVDEVVRLSTEFGILTEYTAFLAREGTDLTNKDAVLAEAVGNFAGRAMNTRSGMGAVNQVTNSFAMTSQAQLNYDNGYFDENMNRVAVAGVQQVSDRAFYRRGARWVDSRIVDKEDSIEPTREIAFGSEEFHGLVRLLAEQGRQGSISLRGDILMVVDGEPILIKGPTGE